jgi:hypothetical protein
LIHGVLLLAVLGFSYQTWTREKKVEPKTGKVVVWSTSEDKVSAIVYQTKDRDVRLDRKAGDGGSYLWGTETRTTRVRPPTKPGEAPDPAAEKTTTTSREFPADERGEEALTDLAELRALRDLGELTEEDKKKYELIDSTDSITVYYEGGQHSIILGGRVYGGADRYIIDTATNRGYAIAGKIISPLHGGESGMNLRKLHTFKDDDVGKVALTGDALGGKQLGLLRTEVEGETGKKKGWADERTPDKLDQTLANVLDRIGEKVRPTQYDEEAAITKLAPLVKVMTARYTDKAGKELGFFELYKVTEPAPEPPPEPEPAPTPDGAKPDGAKPDATKPGATKPDATKPDAAKPDAAKPEEAKPEPKQPEPVVNFYVRTERTRTYGKIGKALGELIEKDLQQVFAD